MEFLPESEFTRRLTAARRARVAELVALGTPAASAKAQATKEFAIYDLLETDERGWIRVVGLDLPPAPTATRRPRRPKS